MPKRRLLLATLAALAAAALRPAWAQHALPTTFDPGRDAELDLRHALATAEAQRKRVFVDLGGEWCTWCHVFDRFIASHPAVARTLDDHYVFLKVNYSPQNPNRQLLSRWPRAAGYPHFYVLDPSGKVLASQRSAELGSGNDYDEGKVLSFLERNVRRR